VQPARSHLPPDYRAKLSHEASRLSRRLREAGHPAPLGDPASGIVLVLEQPVGPRAIEALTLSLQSVGLSEAYVTWAATGFLLEEILLSEPTVLVAVGPGAAHHIDDLGYPLARRPFSEAVPGDWFTWTRGTAGLLLPSLAPALDDDAAKRRFWRAFLALRAVTPTSPAPGTP
jgi:hypothetical protein